ncbi:MAG: alpha-mannosidase, partial [Clostridia bacterium]|nr:alpha-mannosidase [Clostridia bacterium]
MKKKKNIYLVGNAHLDPVWQWRWQEGSAEAKATFRSALDRLNEFPDFIFVCSSASVYRWIEEFDPEMFEEVRQRVRQGRIVVVGGMHVQPDCNNPSGEGFARQALYSQRYFKEKFGVTATVGYNVDSFGHNLMLPQILKKSGMRDYIFMRPGKYELNLENELFDWVSPDGSSVTTYRILDGYSYNFHDMEELTRRLQQIDSESATDSEDGFLFYGVGNHGGGPTVQNLTLIEEYRKNSPEKNLVYSNVSDLFDRIRESKTELPKYTEDLQHHAAGCYASLSAVKAAIRRSECELIAAETFQTLANKLLGKAPKPKAFEEAWNNVCFVHFHDSMGGCSIREAHDDSLYILGSAQNTAAVEANNALQSISWKMDTSKKELGLPVVIFNPNGFDVDELVCVNRYGEGAFDSDGNPVPTQNVYSSAEECMFRTDIMLKAHVPALGYAVYYIRDTWPDDQTRLAVTLEAPDSSVRAIPYTGYRTANNRQGTVLENDLLRIEFELHTGYISSFVDKRSGEELITARAAVPVVVDEYYQDAWGHCSTYFNDYMARFSDAEVTVTESGLLRATVKVVSRYNSSTLTQYFSLEPGSDRLSVRAEIDWREHHKMLKMAWPMKVTDPAAYYEIPFGVIRRPANGEEEPGLMWTAVKGSDR